MASGQRCGAASNLTLSQSKSLLSTVASSGLQNIVIYINKFKIFQAYVTLIFIPVFHECRVYRICFNNCRNSVRDSACLILLGKLLHDTAPL